VVAVIAARHVRSRLRGPSPRRPGRLAAWLAPRVSAADLAWAPEVLARAWAGGGAALVVPALLGGGAVGGGLALLAVVAGPPVALFAARERRDLRLERELPRLLEAVARSLRSGASLRAALGEAATEQGVATDDLALVLAAVDRGAPLGEALDRWAKRRPRPGVRLAAGALVVASTAGGTPARSVDGVAATLRERLEVDREVRALATQARTSALVVTVAPLAFAGLGLLGDGQATHFLLRTRSGFGCLVAGLTLDGAGAWWMARLTRSPT
jgi:tight adherence protein B